MKRKICALGLTAALSMSLLTTAAFAAETSFTDVSGHWAAEAISAVVEKKLFNGTSEDTFSPDASMNRGMFVTVLGRFAENLGYTVSGASTFSDVADDAYYAKYVGWGASNSIVKGVSETEFAPDADVTREQMCTLFVRFLEYVKYQMPDAGELTFVDAEQISDWAADAVKTSVALGLIQGISTDEGMSFDPAGNATRAQVATVFLRLDGLAGIYDLKPADQTAQPVTPATPETPVNPAAPANPEGGAGGGGGGGAASKPVDTSGLTSDQIAKEAEMVGYLETMIKNYDKLTSNENSYLYTTSSDVRDTYNTLMGTLRSAMTDRNGGTALTKEYVTETYSSEISDVKTSYKGMDEEDKNEFKNVAIRLETLQHLKSALNYLGVKI